MRKIRVKAVGHDVAQTFEADRWVEHEGWVHIYKTEPEPDDNGKEVHTIVARFNEQHVVWVCFVP